MQNHTEVLNFSKVFTTFERFNIQRVVELNHVRDYKVNVISGKDFLHEDNRIRAFRILDDLWLIVMNKDVQGIGQEMSLHYLHRVRILKLLSLERLIREEADKEDNGNNTKVGKENISQDKTKQFQKQWFQL